MHAYLNFKPKPVLYSSTLVIKSSLKLQIITVTLLASLLLNILLLQEMPTFVTEALHLVSNLQLVKHLLLLNEQLIQHYLSPLR